MKYLIYILLLTTTLSYSRGPLISDSKVGAPLFSLEVFKYFTEDFNLETKEGTFKVDCYLKIGNDRLSFKKDGDKYKASFTAAVAVFSKDNDDIPIIQKRKNFTVYADTFTETEDYLEREIVSFILDIPTGEYEIVCDITDNNTKRSYRRSESVDFYYFGKTGVTELVLYNSKKSIFNIDSITPIVDNTLRKFDKQLGIYFEVFTLEQNQKYDVSYKIIDNKQDRVVYTNNFTKLSKSHISKELIWLTLEETTIGNFKVILEVSSAGKTFTREKEFAVRWKDISADVSNIKKAIEQMIFVVEGDSLDSVLVKSDDYQKKWFKEYWQSFDPNPDTDDNPVMNEYYRRINYANVNFKSGSKPGWKTDRGQVYCMMGEPDEIQSYAFPKKRNPYEVWIYYSKGVQYIFDYFAGDYILRK